MKKLTIKLFAPHNTSHTTETVRCAPGMSFEAGERLNALVDEFCGRYAAAYPGHVFGVRDLGKGQFNIVWVAETKEAAVA